MAQTLLNKDVGKRGGLIVEDVETMRKGDSFKKSDTWRLLTYFSGTLENNDKSCFCPRNK